MHKDTFAFQVSRGRTPEPRALWQGPALAMSTPAPRASVPDVLVIGGGLVGCLCAWRLAQGGAQVTVLERSVPGAEASSAAAGILGAQCEAREAGLLYELSLESRALYASLAEELRETLGLSIGYRRGGVVDLCAEEGALAQRWEATAWQRAAGHAVEKLDAKALRGQEPSLGVTSAGALYFPEDGRVEPALLVAAVAQAAERAGVRFRTGILVRDLLREGDRVCGVRTEEGELRAEAVVLAAGAWSTLVGGVGLAPGAVRPARGQLVELALRSSPLRSVVYGAGGYLVPRDDGRVVCGSTLEFVGFRSEVTAAGLLKLLTLATAVVPALGEARVLRHWASFRPWTPDGAPLVGEAAEAGLFVATGHHRSGILLAPVTAKLLCERLLGGRSRPGLGPLSPSRSLG